MSTIDWTAIFIAINAAATSYTIWSQKRDAKKVADAKVVADAKAVEVKAAADLAAAHDKLALRARLGSVISTVETIRGEGNSALDIVLRTLANTQRRLYDQTKDPADLKLAETAEARADVADALHAEIDQRLARAKEEQLSIEAQIKKLNGSIPKDPTRYE